MSEEEISLKKMLVGLKDYYVGMAIGILIGTLLGIAIGINLVIG